MRKPKYRIDRVSAATRQMLLEDNIDQLAEQGWWLVSVFVHDHMIWIVTRRSWWWRVMH